MTTITRHPAPPRELDRPAAAGDRFVAGAALVVALLLFALQALAGELIPPLAAFGLIYLGFGVALLRRRPRWLLVTAVVVSALHLVMNIPFVAAGLTHPESPASFLSEAFIGLAILVLLVGAIGALRGAGYGVRPRLVLAALGLSGVAVMVSLIAATGVTSAVAEPGDVPVAASGTTYPAAVEVPAGGAVLWITNDDPFHHTFVVEGTDVHESLPASAAVRAPVDLEAGIYRYFCDVPGHESMEGELVVR